ncbi:ABC transporter substrate-binding protein [Dietzia sp. ANT_WB102]|uniref:ABC transporter substrate-binding protein n=1 Tax=Dietzia sp. ANT_WB102 TaxID=2597345 RepID=UPI0011EF9E87|nr:ABC transporter substrate-binding protein [Dietzia sp. ANT_WB102]KAA0918027.1 amino acid ABC transporter substrate-binding protein [Dietzia sp. ANT_WB102]
MMTSRAKALVAGVAAAALVLTGCSDTRLGDDASASGDGPYRIFFTADMSGPTSSASRAVLAGVKAATEQVNEAGGIGGRQVELIENNDQNDPTKAVSALQEEINSGNRPDMVYPGGSSAVSLSLLPITTREKIFSAGATQSDLLNDPEKFPYHFGTTEPVATYVQALVNELRSKGRQKVAMVFSNDPTGQASEAVYRKGIESAGLEFTSVGYPSDALNMTPQLEQLRATNPDALVFEGYGTPVQYVIQSLTGMRWDIPAYGTATSSTFPLVDHFSPEQLANVLVVQENWAVDDGEVAPEMTDFAERAIATSEGSVIADTGIRTPSVASATVQLARWAAEKSDGDTSAQAMADALTSGIPEDGGDATPWVTDAKGPNPYRYTVTNHFPTGSPDVPLFITPGTYNDLGLYVPGTKG